MKNKCFDEGTMQAFLDGELSSDILENVARHVGICDDCALMLEKSEEESAFAFAALDNEFNTLVPTERIRTNLYQAISEIERPKTSIWKKFLNFGTLLSNPSMAAFAGLAMVAAIFVTFWSLKDANNEFAEKAIPVQTQTKSAVPILASANQNENLPSIDSKVLPAAVQSTFDKVVYRAPKVVNPTERTKTGDKKVKPLLEAISGEETYVKTIASLTETVNLQKDQVLRPSARVAFEKDMAIADNAIDRMKQEVKKNPKNEAAKQVLKNSYQNKIDLLNSVTEKNELMATLKYGITKKVKVRSRKL